MKAKILTVLGIVVLVGMLVGVGTMETHYIRKGNITDITNNVITITDTVGHVWEYETTEEYHIGDDVKMVMDNNTTDTIITDDIIIKLK